MMFQYIHDPEAIETQKPMKIKGLGLIDDDIIFYKEKIIKRDRYNVFGKQINGFEIHHGISKKYPLFYEKENIKGTFIHGLFNDKMFESYKREAINNFVEEMKKRLNIKRIINSLDNKNFKKSYKK